MTTKWGRGIRPQIEQEKQALSSILEAVTLIMSNTGRTCLEFGSARSIGFIFGSSEGLTLKQKIKKELWMSFFIFSLILVGSWFLLGIYNGRKTSNWFGKSIFFLILFLSSFNLYYFFACEFYSENLEIVVLVGHKISFEQ